MQQGRKRSEGTRGLVVALLGRPGEAGGGREAGGGAGSGSLSISDESREPSDEDTSIRARDGLHNHDSALGEAVRQRNAMSYSGI